MVPALLPTEKLQKTLLVDVHTGRSAGWFVVVTGAIHAMRRAKYLCAVRWLDPEGV